MFSGSILCERAGFHVAADVCEKCVKDAKFRRHLKTMAVQRQVDWRAQPCARECEGSKTERESITSNFWDDGTPDPPPRKNTLADKLAKNLSRWIELMDVELTEAARHIENELARPHLAKAGELLDSLVREVDMWSKGDTRRTGSTLVPRPERTRGPIRSCIFRGPEDGEIEETCCGGRKKMSKAYTCLKKGRTPLEKGRTPGRTPLENGRTTDRKCWRCKEYLFRKPIPTKTDHPVDLLIGSAECADCLMLVRQLTTCTGISRPLYVKHLKTDDQARKFLDSLGHTDRYVPLLLSGLKLPEWKAESVTDDPDEIAAYLRDEHLTDAPK